MTRLCGTTTFHPDPSFWGHHLRRFMPSTRRLTTLAGAVFVGVAATAMFAGPASAHTAAVTGKSECETNGTYTIHWQIDNKYRGQDLTLTSVTPTGLKDSENVSLDGGTYTIPGGSVRNVDQKGVPGNTTGAVTLTFAPKWKDGWDDPNKTYSGSVTLRGKCTPDCPPAADGKGDGNGGKEDGDKTVDAQGHKPKPVCSTSPSPSAPAPGNGGGAGAPPAATPSLPVTGSQTGLYAGGAVVLLAAGGGLFMVARRRRLKFQA
jgi:LPXTG-motif cell wall-anchored protein